MQARCYGATRMPVAETTDDHSRRHRLPSAYHRIHRLVGGPDAVGVIDADDADPGDLAGEPHPPSPGRHDHGSRVRREINPAVARQPRPRRRPERGDHGGMPGHGPAITREGRGRRELTCPPRVVPQHQALARSERRAIDRRGTDHSQAGQDERHRQHHAQPPHAMARSPPGLIQMCIPPCHVGSIRRGPNQARPLQDLDVDSEGGCGYLPDGVRMEFGRRYPRRAP